MASPTQSLRFAGLGSALPPKKLTNDDLAATMDTSDAWIRERTGIRERRVGGTTSGLAIEAGQQALARSGLDPDDIDHLILATTTPDKRMPGTGTTVAFELGLSCGAFDLQAACSGWVYGLVTASGLLSQGMERVMLIGSETLDSMVDFTDRSTAVLFGNGAGAAILERIPNTQGGLLSWDLGANGQYVQILHTDHSGSLKMEGREVFRQAVTVVIDSARKTMSAAGVSAADIKLVVPHQANIRILDAAWKKLGLTLDQTAVMLDTTGNTSAASIPLALDQAIQNQRVDHGDLVLFIGFGAGMTWGSALVRWQG